MHSLARTQTLKVLCRLDRSTIKTMLIAYRKYNQEVDSQRSLDIRKVKQGRLCACALPEKHVVGVRFTKEHLLGLAGKFRRVERDGPVDAEDVKQNCVDWTIPTTNSAFTLLSVPREVKGLEHQRNQLNKSFPRELSRHKTCLDPRVRYTSQAHPKAKEKCYQIRVVNKL